MNIHKQNTVTFKGDCQALVFLLYKAVTVLPQHLTAFHLKAFLKSIFSALNNGVQKQSTSAI